jgi:hypothetical protein
MYRIIRVLSFVYLADQLQLYKNKILVEIVSYVLKTIFYYFSHTKALFSIIFLSKIYILSMNNIYYQKICVNKSHCNILVNK